MKKLIVALLAALPLALSLATGGAVAEAAEKIETVHTTHEQSGVTRGTSANSAPRPAYEVLADVLEERILTRNHGKKTTLSYEAELKLELEAAYGFDLTTDSFTDKDFNLFYKRYGYNGLPNSREAYVLNIMQNVRSLFPAIPIEIVEFMDAAANLTIIVYIDRGEGVDGVYFPDSNTIYLMYEGKAVVHEYGHMLHYALMAVTGESAFERQWTALNEGIAYSGRGGRGVFNFETGQNAKGAVFYGDYATTDIYEDVAETFWMMVERPRDLEKLIAAKAPLAKKAALLDALLREQLITADVSVVAMAFEEYALSGGGIDLDGDGYCDDCGEWLGGYY